MMPYDPKNKLATGYDIEENVAKASPFITANL